ncbi:hypothetical protein ACFWHG_08345 [Streptomyces microflavus]|uniref:hypothetical protein n=1 Tax=Streptomyces microflavus TaxID=1919 RepID=UPI003663A97F
MALERAARAHFGGMLAGLLEKDGWEKGRSLSPYADVAGVSPDTIRHWQAGVTAPHRDHTSAVQRLVVHLRRKAGEPAEFSDEWRQALQAAQWEGDDHRGALKGRGETRRAMAAYGAELYVGSPCRDRKAELGVMEKFFDTDDDRRPYLWWQAPPRAGVSVLLTRFVMKPPENADVVAYFVSAATGWNRREHFVGTMVRQLMALMERRVPRAPEKIAPTTLRMYFRQAAAHAAKRNRRLLIVVDGLDRDIAWRSAASDSEPSTSGSIAALLPLVRERAATKSRSPSKKVSPRVIVSSRSAMEPPADVPADHPLRSAGTVRALHPSLHVKDAASVARTELKPLLSSESGRAVAGLLVVADGGLRTQDLAELANVEPSEIERLLDSEGGRCLVPDHLYPGSYALAGDAWARVAREESEDEALDRWAGLLHGWADSWQARNWPTTTPPYLLSRYLRLVRGTDRFERFALDPYWQRRLAEKGLLDEALAQLDRVLRESGDLGVTARAAFARSLLAGGVRLVPKDFPWLFALAGDVVRAWELALSPSQGAAKAARLAYVAEVLLRSRKSESGEVTQRQALAISREAADWAEQATVAVAMGTEADECLGDLTDAGIALHACARNEYGRAMLRSVLSCEAVGWPDRLRAAQSLDVGEGDHSLLAVARHAERLSREGPAEQAEALQIWAELAERVPSSNESIRAFVKEARDASHTTSVPYGSAAIRHRIDAFCDALTPLSNLAHIDLLALAASALAPRQGSRAQSMAQYAERALLHVVENPETLSPSDRAHLTLELSTTLALVVKALRDAGQLTAASSLPGKIPESLCWDVLGDDVREQARVVTEQATSSLSAEQTKGSADDEFKSIEDTLRSHPVRGRHLLAEAFARWEGHSSVSGTQGWGLPLAQALAVGGYAEEAVRLVGHSQDARRQAGDLAVVALGCAVGGRGGEALRYAEEAARAARDLADPALRGLVGQAFAHAGAAGAAEEWGSGGGRTGKEREQVERAQAAVAVGLGPYDPEAAARIVGQQLLGVGRARLVPGGERHLPRIMGLLLALPDPRRPGSDMRAALRGLCAGPAEGIQGWDMRAVLFQALLDVGGCCSGVVPLGGRLDRWEQYVGSTPLPDGVLPVAEWAVLHAVRGDVQGARDAAARASTPEGRVAALAAVATCLAGVPVVVPAADGWAPQDTSVLRFLALADALGTEDPGGIGGTEGTRATRATRDEPEARRLVQEVLAGEHWRYALPLLPRLAPEALPRLAELGLVHGAVGAG